MSKKSNKKRTLKKSPAAQKPPPPADSEPTLPGIAVAAVPAAAFTLRATATADEIFPITGRRDADLRNLAALQLRPDRTPWLPKPAAGQWPTVATLRGLIEYLEHRADRTGALPVFETMDQCAAAIGWSKKFLQQLKKDGCPGFRGTRVHLAEILGGLEDWLAGKSDNDKFKLAAEGVATWSEYKEKFQGLTEQEKYLGTIRETMYRADALAHLRVIKGIHSSGYDRLVEELPTQLAGRTAEQIRAALEKITAELLLAEENELGELEKQADQALGQTQQQSELLESK